MIDSIGGSAGFRPPPPQNKTQELTDDQQSLISSTLSNYDADNLSEEDAISIADTFKDADINPSAEFAAALAESSFDANEIRSLANASGPEGGQRPPPPSNGQGGGGLDLSSITTYLDDLNDSADESSTSSTSVAAMLAEKFGLTEGQSLINVTA